MRTAYRIDKDRIGQARTAVLRNGEPLRQNQAAELLGVHPVTLNKIENGKSNVSLELLLRMCDLYGRSREWLCGEPEAVDELELRREQIAAALHKIGDGLDDLSGLVDVLNGRAHEAGLKAQVNA